MQRLTRFFGTRQDRHEAAKQQRELRLGLFGVLLVVVAMVVTGAIYLLPPGKASYTADLTEAQSIKVGDQVRVAGIPAGTVTDLVLHRDRVTMTFRVDDDIALGDQTSLEIRMLTAVGGHYLAVFPAGERPLGDKTIPADRVKLPYSLVRTLQDAAQPLAAVDGNTLRETVIAAGESIERNPDALRKIGVAMESFVDILHTQNADISRALTVADEYLTTVDTSKSLLGTFVRKLGQLETKGLAKRAEILETLAVVSELLARLAAIEPASRTVLEPLGDKLMEAIPELERLGTRLDEVNRGLHETIARLQATIGPAGITVDESGTTITDTAVCVPIPGRGC